MTYAEQTGWCDANVKHAWQCSEPGLQIDKGCPITCAQRFPQQANTGRAVNALPAFNPTPTMYVKPLCVGPLLCGQMKRQDMINRYGMLIYAGHDENDNSCHMMESTTGRIRKIYFDFNCQNFDEIKRW
jgi:hypothetical protein